MKTKSEEVAADVAFLLRARNPLIWIVTKEEPRVEKYLKEAAIAAGYIPRSWDCGRGVVDVKGEQNEFGPETMDIGETLKVIRSRAEAKSDRGAWIMRDLPPWIVGPGGMVTCRQVRNLALDLPGMPRDAAQALIVISPSGDVPAELGNHATVIEWPMPDRNEVAALLDAQINSLPEFENKVDPDTGKPILDAATRMPIPDPTKPMRALAAPNGVRDAAIDAATGLSGEEAQACYAKSLVQLRKIDPIAVTKEKKRVISKSGVLEWMDPLPDGIDGVGGLEVLKAWALERKLAYSAKARAYGLPPPKGCFLGGIPGCGKTLTAKALASAFGCPLIKLDLGALKGKFVGESEANLRKALRTIEAIGRCVLLIDEVEKALAGATGGAADGGVSSDQLGALLQWMNEPHEAFVIATANDLDSITTNAPEFLRKGRFDELFFVDLPNKRERLEVLRAALKAKGRKLDDLDQDDLPLIVAATDKFTGSEIAELVPSAMFAAFADGERPIKVADLVKCAKATTPLAQTAEAKIKKLKEWAEKRARFASAPENVVELAAVSGGRALDL
ncbi:AAA family ATPase [Bradyrhizobium sp. Tv2a-2]|uniref:AAA family ATPase n=1 Tax=Bradyrhizobium sp. Tv2a-2 TaxID=113395 RepID=UPI000420A27F|nr:AAA family ATPase [Bradyrhizobium sp. Tv2a-2]